MWSIIKKIKYSSLILVICLSFSKSVFALKCTDVRQLIIYYLKSHYSVNDFDQKLAKETLDMYIKSWDPARLYFLEEDVAKIKAKYYSNLHTSIAKADCSAIEDVFSVYSNRYREQYKKLKNIINSDFDFSKDEYLSLDRKLNTYPKDTKVIAEQWRKRVKFQTLQLKEALNGDMKKVREKLSKRYDLAYKHHLEITMDDVYGAFIGSFALAMDPHTSYLSPTKLEDFEIGQRLSLEGIGALLRSEDGITKVERLIPGGAAHKGGLLKMNDQIVAVAQGSGAPVDIIDMDLRDVVKHIRGARKTEVRLTIRRDGKTLIIPIIREKIQLEDKAAKSFVFHLESKDKKEKNYKIGVIDLPSFYMDFQGRNEKQKDFKSSSKDMKQEIEHLKKQKVNLIILDLRSNGGGALDEAVSISGQFIGKGPMVQVRGNSNPVVHSYKDDQIYSGPLIVLIDRQSASASEIVAGALKDYKRAIIVGDIHTFGKGTVQNLMPINDELGAVKITFSKFFRPLGASTQLKGVDADILLPSVSDYYEIGEKYYQNPLAWEKVKEASIKSFSLVSNDIIQKLTKNSLDRRTKNDRFKKIENTISDLKKENSEKTRVSLKEEKKPSKDNKKDKKEELNEDDDFFLSKKPDLDKDIYLQESIYIAGDYLQLLDKKKISALSITELDNKKQVFEKAKDRNKITKKQKSDFNKENKVPNIKQKK